MNQVNVLWIGGGSLGLLYAAKCTLAGAGRHGLLVRTKDQVHKVRAQGLELMEQDRRFTAFLPCVNHPKEVSGCKWIALMVKQAHFQEERLIDQLRHLSSRFPEANWACFQNGIGHMEQLSQWIPAERLHYAVSTEGARRLGATAVEHTGRGTTLIGAIGTADTAVAQKKLIKTLDAAGFDVQASNQIKETVWKKLLINAVINPLTALWRVKNGELLDGEERRRAMRELFDESRLVAAYEGVDIPPSHWDQVLTVCRNTANNHSSMLQDILHGRRTEMEWINGSLLRLGAKHGLHLPMTESIVRRIREVEGQLGG